MITKDAVALKRLLADEVLACDLIEAAALYGSAARGDAESYSDLDILAVCSASGKRQAYAEITSALSHISEKVSICLYTPRELFFLARKRSLFLLHLSKESLLLFDRTGLLTHLLATFHPKASYHQDFRDSLGLLAPLKTSVLGAPNQIHRLAYVYSLFRVFGVYLLAEDHIYEFSKAKMVAALEHKNPHLRREIALLSSLRVLNSCFFAGSCCVDKGDDNALLRASTHALAVLCNEQFDCVEVSYGIAAQGFFDTCRSQNRRLDYRLRTWFLMLLYDGLNLYSANAGRRPLSSFTEQSLSELIESDAPLEIRNAASVGIDYMRNYPLRYFLLEQAKIPVDQACAAIAGINSYLLVNGANPAI